MGIIKKYKPKEKNIIKLTKFLQKLKIIKSNG